jgi:putative membrane-bound dehydrogenase-like protein
MNCSRVPDLLLLTVVGLVFTAHARGQIRDDQAALRTLRVPDGFEIRLFAGADLCHNPTAIDVDVYGRVWVAEGVNYRSSFNPGPGPKDPGADRIKVFEDTDGDGRADRVTVFCDQIPIVPMSVCVAGDQVHVGVAPEWWLFDGASAREPVGRNKRVLLTGFHHTGRQTGWVDHDHAIHGLTLGPDGRLYFTVGDEGMSVTDRSGVAHRPRGGAVVRMEPDGTRMRVLADNFRNPYEACVDSFGRVFCSDNDDDGSAQVRICNVVDGGDYGYRHNPRLPASPTGHHWREDVPGVTPKILRTGQGSPCGILAYEGRLFPERFRGALIHCDCGAAPDAVVRAYHLKPAGAGFTVEVENLVTSTDKWFRPVDVAHAPDGSLYIADWYDAGVGGHGYQDKIIGRIYHLTVKGAPPPAKAPPPDLTTIPGLCSALMSPMPSVRFLAIQKLRERDAEAAAALANMARPGRHPLERARALWVLFGMGEIGRLVILANLKDPDPRFRALAVRMLREDTGQNLGSLLPLAGDADPEVRLEVAIALRDVPTVRCGPDLVRMARSLDPHDPWLVATLARALRDREPELLPQLFAHVETPEAEARALALAWQLNRAETVPFLAAVLRSPKAPDHYGQALGALGWIKDVAAGEAVAAAEVADSDPARVRAALDTLRRNIGSDWRALIERPVFAELFRKASADGTLLPGILSLAGAGGARAFAPQVLEIMDRPRLDPAARKAAVEALGQIRTPEALNRLQKFVAAARQPARPPDAPSTDEMALAALRALLGVDAADADGFGSGLLLDAAYPVDLRREAVRLLGRTPAGCRSLLTLASAGSLPTALKGDAAQVTNRCADKAVREQAAKLLALPRLAGDRPLPPVEEILRHPGDAGRGRAVFFKPQAQCAKCHRVGGVGAWVGPDLSQVGGKLAREGLLDAILNPSAAIAHEYVQYQVETARGQVLAGLVVEETAERLVLKNAEGERTMLPVRDVTSKTALPVSIMPEGLVQNLTDGELVDLLAYLASLKEPARTVGTWHAAGPLPLDIADPVVASGIDLAATYPGKGGAKVGWRKLSADREGRLDLEAACGTRAAAVFLHTALQSTAAQAGRLVVQAPPEVALVGWLNGRALQFDAASGGTDSGPAARAAVLPLKSGKNELALKLLGAEKAALALVATVVSPQGVEAPGSAP